MKVLENSHITDISFNQGIKRSSQGLIPMCFYLVVYVCTDMANSLSPNVSVVSSFMVNCVTTITGVGHKKGQVINLNQHCKV